MQTSHSIFNNPKSNQKLWKKPQTGILKNSPIQFSSTAYKKSADGKSYVKRFFFIKEHYLLYKKREWSCKTSGILDLDWTSVEFNILEPNSFGMVFEITFIKNDRFSSVYLKEESQELRAWADVLRKLCIQTDFREKFTAVQFIDKGSFGKVLF